MTMFARIVRSLAAAAMTAMSMGLTSPGAPVALAAPVAPAASSDNYLSHLSFDQGTLVPAFISTTQEYVLTGVPYTHSVMMSYTTNSTAIFFKSEDGCYGDPLTCDLSRNNILTATIKIWAEDQSTRVYTVIITRPLGVPADPLVAPVMKLSHGALADHTCAVLRTGEVLCWGANNYGQLGLGTTTKEEFVPLTVTGVTDAIDLHPARRRHGAVHGPQQSWPARRRHGDRSVDAGGRAEFGWNRPADGRDARLAQYGLHLCSGG